MNFKFLNKCLLVAAVILLAMNGYVWTTSMARRAEPVSVLRVETNRFAEKPAAQDAQPAAATAAIRWAPLESEEYSEYMANLRKFGFPEELIRPLIIAEIDALYAPRIDPLKPKPVPHDAPLSQRRRQPTPADIVRLREWQKIEIEKQKHLETLLGVHVPRQMIRTPISRNFEGSEYAISLLPPEKREATRIIFENTWIQDDENQSVPESELRTRTGKSEMEAYRAAVEEAHLGLKKFLTDEEFQMLKLNTTPPGTEMLRNIIGMEATDEENLKIFRATEEYWEKTGGVYGRWRAMPVDKDIIDAAGIEAESKVEQSLGSQRYVDYRMARSGLGQEMNNLARRYDLPRETIRDAYATQNELDQLKKAPGGPSGERVAELTGKLQQALGPAIFEAWQNGRGQKYSIDP